VLGSQALSGLDLTTEIVVAETGRRLPDRIHGTSRATQTPSRSTPRRSTARTW
jgi:hypothetical protein